MLLEIIRELIKLTKEKKQEEAYRAQLIKMPLNFDALEHLASKYRDRKITVAIEGGHTITIEPRTNKTNEPATFREKYEAARNKNY